jgi:hypothetical protein
MKQSRPERTVTERSVADALRIGERIIRLTNPDKILYPRAGFTKRQVVDYYIAVAPYLVPHLEHRPVTLKRYPDGTKGQFFYEKDAPSFTPEWVTTFPVPRRLRAVFGEVCDVCRREVRKGASASVERIERGPQQKRAQIRQRDSLRLVV